MYKRQHPAVEGEPAEAVDLPYELLDAAGEALRSGRADLLPALVAAHPVPTGTALDGADDATIVRFLGSVLGDARGRLRALAADVAAEGAPVVGVVSWVLLADGWRALRAHESGGRRLVEIRAVRPDDLPQQLAPVLAEVTR